MPLLKIKVLGKNRIIWGTSRLHYIRSVNAVEDTTISFQNGTGQVFSAGQVFFTTGTNGAPGFLQVRSKNSATLNGNGILSLVVEHFPTSSATDYQQAFEIDSEPTALTLTYNSRPVATDIVVETPNNTTYVFKKSDFTDHYSDADNNTLYEVQINGDVTGYIYNDVAYVEGTWIPITSIDLGRLVYIPTNQSAYYEKDNSYLVRDSSGTISEL